MDRKAEAAAAPIPQSSQGASMTNDGGVERCEISTTIKAGDKIAKEPVEICLRMQIIRTEADFKLLMTLIKTVPVCGMSFEGENIGRDGILAWIVLVAGKTLLPLDMDCLAGKVPKMWEMLGDNVFGNKKLIKVIHNIGPVVDYLYNVRNIEIENVFDPQVADAHVRNKLAPPPFRALSEILETYNYAIPPEEIAFLRKYEKEDFTTNSPMLLKPLPPPEYLKLCAVKVKHLIPLRENLMAKAMEFLTVCTKAQQEAWSKMPNPPDKNQISEAFAKLLQDDLEGKTASDAK